MNASFPSLKDVIFYLAHIGPSNEKSHPAPLFLPSSSTDHFSEALNTLSQKLEEFWLPEPLVLSTALFQPSTGLKPYWPFMKSFGVHFAPITPEGEWRYTGHTDSTRRPADFRPNSEASDSTDSIYDADLDDDTPLGV